MKEEYIIKVCQYLYFKDKDGNRRKKFGNWNTYIYLGNIPESWIDDRDFLDRLKELVRLGDSPDYIDIVPLSELPEEKQAKVRNDFVINSKDHESAQYRINAYIDRKLKQTPAPETATNSAGNQSKRKPRPGSNPSVQRKQKNHRVTNNDLQKAQKLIKDNPALTQEQICAILGVNENCAGYNSDGTPKKLRVVIDNARAAEIGAYYSTGEEQDRAADAFLEDYATSKFEHKRRGDYD